MTVFQYNFIHKNIHGGLYLDHRMYSSTSILPDGFNQPNDDRENLSRRTDGGHLKIYIHIKKTPIRQRWWWWNTLYEYYTVRQSRNNAIKTLEEKEQKGKEHPFLNKMNIEKKVLF